MKLENKSSVTLKTEEEKATERKEGLKKISLRGAEALNDIANTPENPSNPKGLENLSIEEKVFLDELIRQTTANNIKENAHNKYKESLGGSSKLGRVWKGITKKFSIARLEKEEAIRPQITDSTLKNFTNTIKVLREQGVKVGSGGVLEFHSIPEGAQGETKKIYIEYNKTANTLTKIPADWFHGTKEEQNKLALAREDFEKSKGKMLAELSKIGNADMAGKTPKEISGLEKEQEAQAMARLLQESALQGIVQSYFNYPDAGETIKKMENQKWFWGQLGKTMSLSRIKQMGAGATIRTGTKLAGVAAGGSTWWAGLGGAGVAGGLLGFFRGKKNAKENLRVQDWETRRKDITKRIKVANNGVKEISAQEKELLALGSQILNIKNESGREGLNEKYNEMLRKIEGKGKNFVSVESLTQKITKLWNDITEETNPSEQARLMQQLEARLTYTKEKLDEQKLTLGDKSKRAQNQLALIGAVGLASGLILANKNKEITKEIEGILEKNDQDRKRRLGKNLNARDERVNETRKKWVRNQALKGAAYGALFGSAGYIVADYLMPDGSETTGGGDGEVIPSPTPSPNIEIPSEFHEVRVPVSSNGSMQTFADLRHALEEAGYKPGDPNNPSAVNFIFDEKNSSLSKAVGYFRSDQIAESHMAHPGDEYRIRSDGKLIFFDKSAGTETVLAGENADTFKVTPDEKAEMFDSGANKKVSSLNTKEGSNISEDGIEDGALDDEIDATETDGDGTLSYGNEEVLTQNNILDKKGRIDPNEVFLRNQNDYSPSQAKNLEPIYNSGLPKVSTLLDNRFNGGHGPNGGGYEDAVANGGVPLEGRVVNRMITEDGYFFDENQLTEDQVDQWRLLSERFSQKSGGRIDSFKDVYDKMPAWKKRQIEKVLGEYSGFEQNQKILEWFSWEQKSGMGKFFGRIFGTGPGKNININSNGPGGWNRPRTGGGSLPRVSRTQ